MFPINSIIEKGCTASHLTEKVNTLLKCLDHVMKEAPLNVTSLYMNNKLFTNAFICRK